MSDKFFLERVHLGAFGKFFDKTIGPFKPGLNIVYGRNESGKTTTNAFVRGVLFGWEDARGGRNAYKPKVAERHGSLFFRNEATDEVVELSRAKNTEGLKASPADAAALAGDLDKDTFSTVFSIDSDELRDFDSVSDVTAKILTAGSGTVISPAQALVQLDARIATFTSRAASATHSFPYLKNEMDRCRERIAFARVEADEFKDADREFGEVSAERERLTKELAQVNARIETVAACRSEISRAAAQQMDLYDEVRDVKNRQKELLAEERVAMAPYAGVPEMDLRQEMDFRSALDGLEHERATLERRVEQARDTFESARARSESFESANLAASRSYSSRLIVITAAVIVAVFVLAGVFLVSSGIGQGEQGTALVGGGLLVVSAVLAVASLMLLGRSRVSPKQAEHTSEARRSMMESRLWFESCESDLMVHDLRIQKELAQLGFSVSSLPRAKALLDATHDARATHDVYAERRRALDERLARAYETLASADSARSEALERAEMDENTSQESLEELFIMLTSRRDALMADLQDANARYGELKQMLAVGLRAKELDDLKIERAQIVTRQEESAEEFAKLLLARRLLSEALASWESESQPEVYARASRLMEIMTDGDWVGVAVEDDGTLVAVDALRRRREPRFLSTGTCQQLYLALRMALLECAPEVGSAIPVFADDILVNFDDERRVGAAKALAELAKTRQVILFTCHKEVVDSFAAHAGKHEVLTL